MQITSSNRMRVICKVFILAVSVLLFTQCRMTECQVVMADVNIDGWSDEITLSHINKDTTSRYALNLALHVNRLFNANELDVEITTMTPDSLRYTEHVTLPINTPWSTETESTTDIVIPYRQDVHLRCLGEYKIMLAPQHDIVGVEAAGINFQPQK